MCTSPILTDSSMSSNPGASDNGTGTESNHGMSSDVPLPSPELDVCVLDSKLGLRSLTEKTGNNDTPQFSAYKSDLHSIHCSSAESAVNDSDSMLPLSYGRQFISRNVPHVRKLCCGETDTFGGNSQVFLREVLPKLDQDFTINISTKISYSMV